MPLDWEMLRLIDDDDAWYIAGSSIFGQPSSSGSPGELLYLQPIVSLPYPCRLRRLAFVVVSTGTNHTFRLGVYESQSNLLPGRLLYDSGPIPVNPSGTYAVEVGVELSPNRVYYPAIVKQTVGSYSIRMVPIGQQPGVFGQFNPPHSSPGNYSGVMTQSGVTGTLPAQGPLSRSGSTVARPAVFYQLGRI